MSTESKVVPADASDVVMGQLLDAWVNAVCRYDRLFEGEDCCWWYNERSNVSVLAGAAWMLGWIALEECPTEKKKAQEVSGVDQDVAKGRIDLYISTPSLSLFFEAKHVWQMITQGGESADISAGRVSAKKDAERLEPEDDARFFAATFIIPFFEPDTDSEKHPSVNEARLNAWLEDQVAAMSSQKTSFAYVFPRFGQERFQNQHGFTYPGVVLVLEEVFPESSNRSSDTR